MNEQTKKIKDDILHRIDSLLIQKNSVIIAIDGNCAAGKTTLAAELSSLLSANVLHIDDFYLPFERRTPEIMSVPGGNIDFERIINEVFVPVSKQEDYLYIPYVCKTKDFKKAELFQHRIVTIVEGAYSCHPLLSDYYDLKVFLSVSPQEQIERIINRNGSEKAKEFVDLWIKREEDYFAAYDIRGVCDILY